MREAFAIAIAKAKRRLKTSPPVEGEQIQVEEEISKAGMGSMLVIAAVFGLGGFVCLMVALSVGGAGEMLRGFVAAITGGH